MGGADSTGRADALIRLEKISVARDGVQILSDVSWQVNPGEHWVLFGPNGAGKTSILNVVQGYLWPTSGTVRILGGELGNGVDVRELRQVMPVVSESVRRLIPDHLSGLEVLVTGARGHLNIFDPLTNTEIDAASDMAKRTQVTSLLDKPFRVMSTGERQRVLISRALMPRPELLILDEPCAGLDLAGREWVLELIERISAEPAGPGLLLTTHHLEEIAPGFSHGLLINDGQVFGAGRIQNVLTSENLGRLFGMDLTVTFDGDRWSARRRKNEKSRDS